MWVAKENAKRWTMKYLQQTGAPEWRCVAVSDAFEELLPRTLHRGGHLPSRGGVAGTGASKKAERQDAMRHARKQIVDEVHQLDAAMYGDVEDAN